MPAGAITLADIQSADWSLMLDATAVQLGLSGPGSGIGNVVQGVADINQCIAIILSTPPGSDPLRPTFGCNLWRFIDYPVNAAIPHLVREITEALTIWEPRIKVLSVVVNLVPNDVSANVNAHLNVAITWQLNAGSGISPAALQSQTLTLTLPGSL
jgi:uncharacterized protein